LRLLSLHSWRAPETWCVTQHYRALVQVDSTAGKETRVVEYRKKVLEAAGIPTQTFALDPKRANLMILPGFH